MRTVIAILLYFTLLPAMGQKPNIVFILADDQG